MFSLIYAWINDWVNNREAGDLRRQRGHYDVIVMNYQMLTTLNALIVSNDVCISYMYFMYFVVHGEDLAALWKLNSVFYQTKYQNYR